MSNNHCADGASWLHGDDGWLMSLLFTEGWEGCDNFLKLENSNICHTNWCFLSQFLGCILPTVELLSELKLFLSNLCVALSSVCCTLNLLVVIQRPSPGVNSISRKHCLSSSIGSNSSSPQALSWECSNLVISSGSTLSSSPPAVSTPPEVPYSAEVQVIQEGWNQLRLCITKVLLFKNWNAVD